MAASETSVHIPSETHIGRDKIQRINPKEQKKCQSEVIDDRRMDSRIKDEFSAHEYGNASANRTGKEYRTQIVAHKLF